MKPIDKLETLNLEIEQLELNPPKKEKDILIGNLILTLYKELSAEQKQALTTIIRYLNRDKSLEAVKSFTEHYNI